MSVPNPELQLANDFVQFTNRNIFLTGKAGTGKTTFLRNLKAHSPKRMIITAPTGVAAINAGGVTLHSFFQMPFGPIIPNGGSANNNQRFSKDKINIIRSLDLLVIDEISMVRADVLDAVDEALRRYRRNSLPFGGVQLLMIGDLHQLSPVMKDDEWAILRAYYDSYYFFSSLALKKSELMPIELKHIYRQTDGEFIRLLNRVRDNQMDDETLSLLNSRYIPDFSPDESEGYITLSTHNNSADRINDSKLAELTEKGHKFKAVIEGTFPEYTYPTSKELELKVGAQVMFVRNDNQPERRYFNGKIGKVVRFFNDVVHVRCPGDDDDIVVDIATWENIKYEVDAETSEIKESIIGKFIQFPLKLAWAITIHKSQGLTFEKAIIDARDAFAHGQVYVALSRCKTFSGLVLSTAIVQRSVKTDGTVSSFVQKSVDEAPTLDALQLAKVQYQQGLLLDCFNLGELSFGLRKLMTMLIENATVIQVLGVGAEWRELEPSFEKDVLAVSEKFMRQLQKLFATHTMPSEDEAILERVKKASSYFVEKMDSTLMPFVNNLITETDNKEIRKRLKLLVDEFKQEALMRVAGLRACMEGFSPANYLRAISLAQIDFKPSNDTPTKSNLPMDYSASDIKHPKLFAQLKQWRDEKATEEAVPHYRILQQKTMIQIAVHLPNTLPLLKKIKGIGARLAEKYGEDLLGMIKAFREENGIKEVVLEAPKTLLFDEDTSKEKSDLLKPEMELKDNAEASKPETLNKKKLKVSTFKISYGLFLAGLTIDEIAQERGLSPTTIEGHLSRYVESGDLKLSTFVSNKKLDIILPVVRANPESTLTELRERLEDVSFGELRMVIAHNKFLEAKALK